MSSSTCRAIPLKADYQFLVGKEAVEDMIALMRTGCRHVDPPPGIAVEVASYDPNQKDGPLQIVVLIERIEVSLAILIGVVSRRGVETSIRPSAITIHIHLLDPDVDRSMAEFEECRLEWSWILIGASQAVGVEILNLFKHLRT
jgi:hypothetical protein